MAHPSTELVAVRKDGTLSYVDASASRWIMGSRTFVTIILRDVNERRAVHEALRASEEKYKDIVRLIQEGIWMTDASFRTTFVNEEMAKILNYTVAEMQGRPLFEQLQVPPQCSSVGCARMRREQPRPKQRQPPVPSNAKFCRRERAHRLIEWPARVDCGSIS